MRELTGTVVIVLAIFSAWGWADVNLCLHIKEKVYCTKVQHGEK